MKNMFFIVPLFAIISCCSFDGTIKIGNYDNPQKALLVIDMQIDYIMGFAWDISAAIELWRSNHGLSIGLKYWGLTQEYNEFGYYGDRMVNNAFGIFFKYVYRYKVK